MSSKIILTNNLSSHTIQEEIFVENDYSLSVFFKFIFDNEQRDFSNLKFGVSIKTNGDFIASKQYPTPGLQYISTDQDYLEVYEISLIPDTLYDIEVWFEESGHYISKNIIFESVIPKKPYESWIWKNKEWVSPVPMPELIPGQIYAWNEENLSWEIFYGLGSFDAGYTVE